MCIRDRDSLPGPPEPDAAADADVALAPGAQGRHQPHQRGPAGGRSGRVMRVVFFGTPDFAVVSLKAMLRERISVVGVVTQPDKPQGRSRTTLVPPPVKVVAQAEGLPILQ